MKENKDNSLEYSSIDELLTIEECCIRLKVSRQHFYRLRKAGKIGVVAEGRYIRVRASAIDAYLQKISKPPTHRKFRLEIAQMKAA